MQNAFMTGFKAARGWAAVSSNIANISASDNHAYK